MRRRVGGKMCVCVCELWRTGSVMRLGTRGWEGRCSSGILGVLRQEQIVATEYG